MCVTEYVNMDASVVLRTVCVSFCFSPTSEVLAVPAYQGEAG